MWRALLRFTALTIILFALIIGGFLLYVSITDYKPDLETNLVVRNPQESIIIPNTFYSITTYNIGYGGMDAEQDFFMDGGTASRSKSLAQTEKNVKSMIELLQTLESDFYILQEVDVEATRSYKINQNQQIADAFDNYSASFAYNYKVPWVPIPITQPMGKVESGLLTLSKYKATSHKRFQLPGEEGWPIQLFELDRAIVETRLPVRGNQELVLVNLHLSAFDEGGTIRKQQLQFLTTYIEREVQKGSYIIIGGDWNHMLTSNSLFTSEQSWPSWLQQLPSDFTPKDFSWAIDERTATNRTVDIPYTEGVNFLTIIDGFLVSSNVEIESVKTTSNSFATSDHHPVTLTFKLKRF